MRQPVSCDARRTFCPLLANRKREHVVRNDELHPMVLCVDDDPRNLGWGNGAANETSRVIIVGHDVDLLVAQLLNDCLDSRAAHANTCANWYAFGPRVGR